MSREKTQENKPARSHDEERRGQQQATPAAHRVSGRSDRGKKRKKSDLKERNVELEHKYKRALADYQNLLKQVAAEKQEFAKFANEQLLYEILPVYDNLKMSLKHADKEAKNNGWLEGVEHVVKQFRGVLENIGVEEIKVIGKKFDPRTMEAVEGNGDKVKQEVKSGYRLNGKIIIPAKVIVG